MNFKDQLGRLIQLTEFPKRIISTVPSQTELLFDLGLQDSLLGITKFCIHPKDKVKSISKIGGTKKLNLNKILDLNPDLIIANKEENTKEDIEYLASKCPTWISDISNLQNALDAISDIGEITDTEDMALKIKIDIQFQFNELQKSSQNQKVVYLIWQNPYISIGNDTFIHDMIEKMGWTNAFQNFDRYPEVTTQMIKDVNPDRILLSSEPYPFQEKHISNFVASFPNSQIHLVDGEFFSWYGSRLLQAPKYFKSIL